MQRFCLSRGVAAFPQTGCGGNRRGGENHGFPVRRVHSEAHVNTTCMEVTSRPADVQVRGSSERRRDARLDAVFKVKEMYSIT